MSRESLKAILDLAIKEKASDEVINKLILLISAKKETPKEMSWEHVKNTETLNCVSSEDAEPEKKEPEKKEPVEPEEIPKEIHVGKIPVDKFPCTRCGDYFETEEAAEKCRNSESCDARMYLMHRDMGENLAKRIVQHYLKCSAKCSDKEKVFFDTCKNLGAPLGNSSKTLYEYHPEIFINDKMPTTYFIYKVTAHLLERSDMCFPTKYQE